MKPALLAIGNFDGVHRGHRHLLSQVLTAAERDGLRPGVMTFDPHPSQVLGRTKKETLTCLERKRELLSLLSPQLEVFVETFDVALSQMSPKRFAEELIRNKYGARRVVVGENFRFGFRREGNLKTLQALGSQLGFSADASDLLAAGEAPISSSRIRAALRAGDLEQAEQLLGRPHAVRGVVVSGDRRGRQLGYPTANLSQVEELLPPNGVYAGRAAVLDKLSGKDLAERAWPAIANFGRRPTLGVSEARLSVEVHLIGFSGDLYGRTLQFEPLHRVREEQRFETLAALESQIRADVVEAERLLRDATQP